MFDVDGWEALATAELSVASLGCGKTVGFVSEVVPKLKPDVVFFKGFVGGSIDFLALSKFRKFWGFVMSPNPLLFVTVLVVSDLFALKLNDGDGFKTGKFSVDVGTFGVEDMFSLGVELGVKSGVALGVTLRVDFGVLLTVFGKAISIQKITGFVNHIVIVKKAR